jgi:hypothetical protein
VKWSVTVTEDRLKPQAAVFPGYSHYPAGKKREEGGKKEHMKEKGKKEHNK